MGSCSFTKILKTHKSTGLLYGIMCRTPCLVGYRTLVLWSRDILPLAEKSVNARYQSHNNAQLSVNARYQSHNNAQLSVNARYQSHNTAQLSVNARYQSHNNAQLSVNAR